ncbi:MAG: hypothetical protein ABS81_04940 [Pseudonocardia sp. SCN 72-86]|nr:MAG: hypothetical protein ABS81_04940 [Pseudonocardia sp. SCN 72-86]
MAWWRRSGPDLSGFNREGLLHQETAGGTITYRHYRAPGRYSSWAKEPRRWTVILTQRRFTVLGPHGPVVNVPWTDHRFATLDIRLDGEKLLIVADVSKFGADASGYVEVRAKCADSAALLGMIRLLQRHVG